MGILDRKCDSCNNEAAFLFPIVVLDELPSGGLSMVTHYYCIDCYGEMQDIASEDEDEDDDAEDNDSDSTGDKCDCCGKKIVMKKDQTIIDYFCYGCSKLICSLCSTTLDGVGRHTLEDHKKACSDKEVHF